MKYPGSVKELGVRAVREVRDLLGSVPPVEIESVEYESEVDAYGVDGLIGLKCHGGSYALVVEVKSEWGPPVCPVGGVST